MWETFCTGAIIRVVLKRSFGITIYDHGGVVKREDYKLTTSFYKSRIHFVQPPDGNVNLLRTHFGYSSFFCIKNGVAFRYPHISPFGKCRLDSDSSRSSARPFCSGNGSSVSLICLPFFIEKSQRFLLHYRHILESFHESLVSHLGQILDIFPLFTHFIPEYKC